MGSEIKSGRITIEFALSASLKKSIQARAKKEKKSAAQWLRDLAQAELKKKK